MEPQEIKGIILDHFQSIENLNHHDKNVSIVQSVRLALRIIAPTLKSHYNENPKSIEAINAIFNILETSLHYLLEPHNHDESSSFSNNISQCSNCDDDKKEKEIKNDGTSDGDFTSLGWNEWTTPIIDSDD